MANAKELSGAGLRGQIAGKTALSTVGKTGSGLTYRGYDVKDLAAHCEFEEVAHLILKGELPVIRGGFSDRFGNVYAEGLSENSLGSVNINIKDITPRPINK